MMDNNNNNNKDKNNNARQATPEAAVTRKPQSPVASFAPSQDFIKSLSLFFQRDVIAIPLVKRTSHQSITQRCNFKAATLELDTAAYPNLDYIAGNRLSIYPVNSADHVNAILRFIINDLQPATSAGTGPNPPKSPRRARLSDPWEFFVQVHGRDSVRMALLHIYDITTAPSRDLLHALSNHCANKEHKTRLLAISGSDDTWERWVCSGLRTLRSTLEEFNSISIPAKILFGELTLQQPRQYSISNIKSRKRFRTEVVIVQHKFTTRQIGITLQNIKDREINEQSQSDGKQQLHHITHQERDLNHQNLHRMQSHPTNVRVAQNDSLRSGRSSASIRSLRSVATFGSSPITSQQVSKVPAYAGKLMSLYASSKSSMGTSSTGGGMGSNSNSSGNRQTNTGSNLGNQQQQKPKSSSQSGPSHEGLCSTYLLNVKTNEHIICEFVENPRFTLKGNRERPIMMIGQAIGSLAFRAFWQQRALEHDRAQMFYTLFKDLSPKKFGDLHLVNITGNACKIEELFKREIVHHLEHKVLSSAFDIDRIHLQNLLDSATNSSMGGNLESLGSMVGPPVSPMGAPTAMSGPRSQTTTSKTDLTADNQPEKSRQNPRRSPRPVVAIKQAMQRVGGRMRGALAKREVFELGNKLSRLLMDNNGCLYICCDLAMTQAIEILIVESVVRNHPTYSPDQVVGMLAKWKGNTVKYQSQMLRGGPEGNKFLFTLQNPFERAQIVEEIYDETI